MENKTVWRPMWENKRVRRPRMEYERGWRPRRTLMAIRTKIKILIYVYALLRFLLGMTKVVSKLH